MSRSVKATYTFFVILFSLGTYFLIQSSVRDIGVNLMTPLDASIPLIPEFVWIYHSLLPVIVLTSVFIVDQRRNIFTLIAACVASTIVLNIFYIFYPAFYPRSEYQIALSGMSEHVLYWTRKIDGANNTFPSGHVTFAWLMFWGIKNSLASHAKKWLTPAFFIWASLVSFSTLALKQHYIVDVFSGLALATLTYLISKKIIQRD